MTACMCAHEYNQLQPIISVSLQVIYLNVHTSTYIHNYVS